MSPECKALPAVSRVASAAGALAMTSVLLLAVGLGFPPGASAAAPQIAKVGATAVASVTATAPVQANAVWFAEVR